MNDAATKWVKDHKKSFARKLIRDAGVSKSEKPTAIFMAGLPGAGKTEFTKNLIANLGIKIIRLDMDEIAEQIETYTPQQADRFRGAASILLSRTFDTVIHGGYDFVMDGTFGSNAAMEDIKRALNRKYAVKIFYIYQNPQVAWKYTQAREKVEHRAIDKEGFITSYYKIINNLKRISQEFSDVVVDLVIKNDKNGIREIKDKINI